MGQEEIHAWVEFNSATYPVLKGKSLRIGRSIDSDLRLFEDTSVSREHCVIRSEKDRLEITDLDSRNGTVVNGRRISEPTELHHRDVVKVGESKLTVLFEIDEDIRGTLTDFTLGR